MTHKSNELVKKQAKGVGDKPLPAQGHNSDQLLKDYVSQLAKKEAAIEGIRGEIKDILSNAKNDGFLKTSLRNTVKKLRMSEEQRQAKSEVDKATEEYTALCKDLPLWAHAA